MQRLRAALEQRKARRQERAIARAQAKAEAAVAAVAAVTESSYLDVRPMEGSPIAAGLSPISLVHSPKWAATRWSRRLWEILTQTAEAYRSTLVESWLDLTRYNLLQPGALSTEARKGAKVRAQQWARMGGEEHTAVPPVIWPVIGAAAAALVGGLIGLNPETRIVPIPALIGGGAFLGAVSGYLYGQTRTTGFTAGMMRIIVNERASRIHPEVVTNQVEIWVPKSLVQWRSHEWREKDGQPYLMLMLPYGEFLQDHLTGTEDYLTLPNDPHRARNMAIYGQRTIGRMVGENAGTWATVDKNIKDQQKSEWNALMPKIAALVVIGLCVLLILYGGDA